VRCCWAWRCRARRSASTRSCSARSTTPSAAACSRSTTWSSTWPSWRPRRARRSSSHQTGSRRCCSA
jgi:hypothetical protein